MDKILILNGPNLNLLGTREPDRYGSQTLADLEIKLGLYANELGHTATFFQSQSEAELISRIHKTIDDQTQFMIFNPAAFTHTSIALRDAILAVKIPFIEVHISNIYQRETFRQKSYFSDISEGVILGVGLLGYELALTAAVNHLNSKD